MTNSPRKITDDPYGAAILIRRLVTEQGLVYWRSYLRAFVLMAVAAGATAGAAYVLGQVINQAYVDRTSPASRSSPASSSSCCSSRAWRPTATP